MSRFRLLGNTSGAIPIALIWAIVMLLLFSAAGVLAYFASHIVSLILVFLACGVLFITFILPNSQAIIRWIKDTIHEIKK